MLILKRKAGEGIDVGENVRIVLKEISGGHVKIGVEAPASIRVKRSEIAVSIREENVRAVRSLVAGGGDLKRLDGIACVSGSEAAGRNTGHGEAAGA